MILAGEYGIALEILCEQLSDVGVAVSAELTKEIAECGRKMEINPNYWETLQIAAT